MWHVFQVIPRFKVKLEKSCSFFVAQSKSKEFCAHPIEFESLIGCKMLFAIDLSSKVGSSIGGSFRVKRVCMDSKGMSGCVDLDSDVDSISNDSGGEVQAMEFATNVIVTPPIRFVKVEDDGEAPPINSSKDVDDGRLKKIKVEKE
ncbi:hypothetical protein P8452_32600 [Trifolium repens]|nr:hypothetical protein P8452_32600 [Trifolium repens]